ncbi:MAG: SWIM zinc finger family protein [Anaerolineae bacterium]|nr:SWIM zinc finger family protein [Anaerolineae bacterium]
MLSLQNFKEMIPAAILARGLSYYNGGQVVSLDHPDDQTWLALVEGSETYDVEIVDTGEDGLLECSCTCPYEYGEHCKHVVAVLYAIEAEALAEAAKPGKKGKKAPTPQEQLRKLLKDVSREQLIEVVLEKAKYDKQFALNLVIQFDKGTGDAEDYGRIVRSILDANKGRHGYIEYRDAINASHQLNRLINRAASLVEQGEIDQAIALYQALIEGVGEGAGNADDSSGSLGSIVGAVVNALGEMLDDLSPDQRATLYKFMLRASQIDWLRWTDASTDMLSIAGMLVDTDEQQADYFEKLDASSHGDTTYSDVEDDEFVSFLSSRHTAQDLKRAVIERRKGKAAAIAFMESHLDNDAFRRATIERRVAEGKLDEAQWLAEEALAKYEKTQWAGLVRDYRAILLNIAVRRGDKGSIKLIARRSYLESGDKESLAALKAAIPADAWYQERDSLIRAMERTDAHWLTTFLAGEGLWEEVMLCAQARGLNGVSQYLNELDKRFPDRMADLYEKHVLSSLKNASMRTEYEAACNLLKRLKAMPGQSVRLASIVAHLQSTYPRRRALLDELKKV